MRIILIRHPVTKANIEGIVLHNVTGELDERGYEQISKLVKRLEHEPIDKIYSSDAYRCKILVEEIANSRGLNVNYNPLFREIDHGELFGKKKDEISRLFLENPEYVQPKNGESLTDLAHRAQNAFYLIKNGGGEKVILISHGWFLKMFLGNQLGMTPHNSIKKLKFSNCAISEIKLTEDDCIVEYLNNRDYLK